jgi:hypothetical protein
MMEHSLVMRMIGTNYSEEKEEEANLWHMLEHVPLVLRGPAIGNERFQKVWGDDTHPKYLATYEFESERDLNAYLGSALLKEARNQVPKEWREKGHFKSVWSVNYRRIAKRGDDDRSLAFSMVGTNCPRGANEVEFNDWYNHDHMVFVLRNPNVIRAERYQRIGDDEKYPKYLAIYRYDNEKTIVEGRDMWVDKLAIPDRRKTYPDDVWDRRWFVRYKLISKQRKDLIL